LTSLDDVRRLPLSVQADQLIYLGDIAEVSPGKETERVSASSA